MTLAPPERLGSASSLQYVGSTMGSAIGAAIGGAILARSSGFRTLALAMLVTSLPVLTVTALAMPSLAAEGGSSSSAPIEKSTRSDQPSTGLSPPVETLGELLARPAVRALLMMQYPLRSETIPLC